MRKLDQASESVQLDWLVMPAWRCPDEETERRIMAAHFRVPHEPWVPSRAFVAPVAVRRSRRRVLFVQQSGLVDTELV
jgi:hypothetical protein